MLNPPKSIKLSGGFFVSVRLFSIVKMLFCGARCCTNVAPARSVKENHVNQKVLKPLKFQDFFVVLQRGFEPRTPCLKGRCSAY